MPLSEFELIEKYFHHQESGDDVLLGIGDDAAVVSLHAGENLVVTVDTSLVDVHFPANADPFDIGYRCLAVNLSDLAAMGATPRWITLSISLPQVDENWLTGFSLGLRSLLQQYRVTLIGGDTTRGPLTVTIQAKGVVKQQQFLTRSGARDGDLIFVSGTLGDAAAGLVIYQQQLPNDSKVQRTLADADAFLLQRFMRPSARVELGKALIGLASSCIDISDGLLADLGHIMERSGCGAQLDCRCLPLSDALQARFERAQQIEFALRGGDDYELCFTAPSEKEAEVLALAQQCGVAVQCIGRILSGSRLLCIDDHGKSADIQAQGYRHF